MCPRRWPASSPTSRRSKPDHIALTGDLVNVALPQEYRRAAEWLAAFDTPDRITVIPGNHDVYVSVPWAESLGLWGAYMAGDGQPPASGLRRLPDRAPARRHRPDRAVDRRAEAAAAGDRRSRRRTDRARRDAAGGDRPRGAVPDRADPSSAAHRPVALEASQRCRGLPGDDPPGRLRGGPARPQPPQRVRPHRRPATGRSRCWASARPRRRARASTAARAIT